MLGGRELWRKVFPWPLVPAGRPAVAMASSVAILVSVLLSRLLLLADGPWEQDEALLAAGVIDFDPAHHMPLPPGFPLWILLGRVVRLLGVVDPVLALQVASSVLSVAGLWALVGLWDRLAGRSLALAGAAVAAFLPGVWIHAGRAFSETASATCTLIALALWLRGGRLGFSGGMLMLTAAALIRPPLAPFFVVIAALAAWWVRTDLRLLARTGLAATVLVLVVLLPLVAEAGGWRVYWEAGRVHASEHFVGLADMTRAVDGLGFVRGLGTVWVALGFLGLALAGWVSWWGQLGRKSLVGLLGGGWLAYLLLFVHNPTYARYYVLAWLLLATPAVRGLRLVCRSPSLTGALALAGAAVGAWWTVPALWVMHTEPLPVMAALRQVAAEGEGVLVFEDRLFSFRDLTYRTRELRVHSLRESEIPRRRLSLGGVPVWFLTESVGKDVPSTVSQSVEFAATDPRVVRLSQERFLHARLVRNPVLAWRGAHDPEQEGADRFIWCGREVLLLVPPVTGAGSLALALEVHGAFSGLPVRISVARSPVMETVLGPGRQILRIPLPANPTRNRLAQVMPVEIFASREARVAGDYRGLCYRLFRASVEAPPHRAAPTEFFPEESSLFSSLATAEGFFGPELMGTPARPAVWAGPVARVRFPASAGLVGVEMLAPRPEPALVEVHLGQAQAQVLVGPEATLVALPVPGERASSLMVELEIRSSVFVPGSGDQRQLGVAVSRIWFMPRQ